MASRSILSYDEIVLIATVHLRRCIKPAVAANRAARIAMPTKAQEATPLIASILQQRSTPITQRASESKVSSPSQANRLPFPRQRIVSHHSLPPTQVKLRALPLMLSREQIILGHARMPHTKAKELKEAEAQQEHVK